MKSRFHRKARMAGALVWAASAAHCAPILSPQDGGPDDNTVDARPADRSLVLVRPSGPATTRGVLTVEVQLTGPNPESVVLLCDGSPFGQLSAGETAFEWDTRGVSEGTHVLTARAEWRDLSITSLPRTVVVDRQVPTVASRTPAPGDTNVPFDAPILATFSEPIDPATLAVDTVSLRGTDGAPRASTFSLSSDGLTLTVRPSPEAVVAPDELTVVLGANIADRAGNRLSADAAPWTWRVPGWLTLDQGIAHPAGVVVDPVLTLSRSGSPVLAAKLVLAGGQSTARAAVAGKWDGTQWLWMGAPQVGTRDVAQVDHVRAVVDTANQVVLAWDEQASGSAHTGVVVKRWNNESWDMIGPVQNTDPATTSAFEPSVGVTNTGTLYLAWSQRNATDPSVWVRGLSGTVWVNFLAGIVREASPAAQNPVLAVAPRGQIFLAYNTHEGTTSSLRVMRAGTSAWDILSSLAPPLGVNVTEEPASIALDAQGNPVTVWTQRGTSGTGTGSINVARWDGVSWNAAGLPITPEPNEGSTSQAQVQLDAAGTPWIGWTNGRSISLVTSTATGWAPVTPALTLTPGATVERVSFALGPSDIPVVVWSERSPSNALSVHARRMNR